MPSGLNLAASAGLAFGVQGLAVIKSMLTAQGMAPGLVLMLFVFAWFMLGPVLLVAATGVGLMDLWLDFRRLEPSCGRARAGRRQTVEVILIDDVEGLGKKGATVKVKNGYARNFLVPRKLAIPAGLKAAKVFLAMAKQRDIAKDKDRKAAEAGRREVRRRQRHRDVAGGRGRHAVRLDHLGRHRRRCSARRVSRPIARRSCSTSRSRRSATTR